MTVTLIYLSSRHLKLTMQHGAFLYHLEFIVAHPCWAYILFATDITKKRLLPVSACYHRKHVTDVNVLRVQANNRKRACENGQP
jgi:hypothetical protein